MGTVWKLDWNCGSCNYLKSDLLRPWILVITHTATHCNALQHTATHCNTLQHTATHCDTRQHTATHCNKPQHTATHCNTLQHTATRCNRSPQSVDIALYAESSPWRAFSMDSYIYIHTRYIYIHTCIESSLHGQLRIHTYQIYIHTYMYGELPILTLTVFFAVALALAVPLSLPHSYKRTQIWHQNWTWRRSGQRMHCDDGWKIWNE